MTFYGYTDPDSIKRMVDTNKQLLISLIENMIDEINIFGIPEKESSKESGLNINITQNQTARINLSLIVDSIQNELTGMQLKELQKIIGEKEEDENKHKEKVIEKLKSFGSDVASNILANILTNPQLFGA
jgi:hypothetical protein